MKDISKINNNSLQESNEIDGFCHRQRDIKIAKRNGMRCTHCKKPIEKDKIYIVKEFFDLDMRHKTFPFCCVGCGDTYSEIHARGRQELADEHKEVFGGE